MGVDGETKKERGGKGEDGSQGVICMNLKSTVI